METAPLGQQQKAGSSFREGQVDQGHVTYVCWLLSGWLSEAMGWISSLSF